MAKIITAINGPSGTGRHTLIELFGRLSHTTVNHRAKMKNILKSAMGKHGRFGARMREYEDNIKTGVAIPDDALVLEALRAYMDEMRSYYPSGIHIMLSGFPGTPGQIEFLKDFDECLLVHLEPTKDQAQRIQKDNPVQWQNYLQQVVPAFKAATQKGYLLKPVHRAESLVARLKTLVEHAPMPDHTRVKLNRRLATDIHPVRLEIDRIEAQLA